jgi:hypothetical protein
MNDNDDDDEIYVLSGGSRPKANGLSISKVMGTYIASVSSINTYAFGRQFRPVGVLA